MTKTKKNYFIDNKELYAETIQSQKAGKMSERLAEMLMLMATKYKANRIVRANFLNYTYFEDMKSYGLLNLVTAYKKFDGDKYKNAFAFYTRCIHNSYLQYMNKEKQHRNIRDSLLVDKGLNPSFKFTEEYNEKMKSNQSDEDGEMLSYEDIIDDFKDDDQLD